MKKGITAVFLFIICVVSSYGCNPKQTALTEKDGIWAVYTARKKVVIAGPVFNPTFGLIILRVDSEKEARQIMAAEPSVAQNIHTYEMQLMNVPSSWITFPETAIPLAITTSTW